MNDLQNTDIMCAWPLLISNLEPDTPLNERLVTIKLHQNGCVTKIISSKTGKELKSDDETSSARTLNFEKINMMELVYEEYKVLSMAFEAEDSNSHPFSVELHVQYARVGTLNIMQVSLIISAIILWVIFYILSYLHCAKITPNDLAVIDTAMKTPYNPNFPIKTLFEQIINAVEYTSRGKTPYTPLQIVFTTNHLVFNTGGFVFDCKEWRKRAAATQTWPHFLIFWTEKHMDYREEQTQTTGQGFQANKVTHHQ